MAKLGQKLEIACCSKAIVLITLIVLRFESQFLVIFVLEPIETFEFLMAFACTRKQSRSFLLNHNFKIFINFRA